MKIKRDIVNKFKEWKDAAKHKPILLKGARQIGKTWAMEEFGKECFDYTAKFDFDRQKELLSAFTVSKPASSQAFFLRCPDTISYRPSSFGRSVTGVMIPRSLML